MAAARRQLSLVRKEQILLVEQRGIGRSACFTPVAFDGEAAPGTFMRVRITGIAGAQAQGRIAP